MFFQILVLILCLLHFSAAAVSCDNDNYSICYVKNQQVSDTENFEISRTTGVPITDLLITNTAMPLLPSTIFINYPNVSFLSLSTNGLTRLLTKNFANAVKLKKMFIQNGFLKRIHNGTFRTCPSLDSLQLTKQQISVLEVKAFQGLNLLTTLNLNNNSIEILHPNVFSTLPNLTLLSVDMNKIKKLSPKLFLQNQFLLYVSFEQNQLTAIPASLFASTPIIGSIYVTGNLLTDVRTYGANYVDASFNSLQSLHIDPGSKMLQIHDNFIQTIDCSAVSDFTTIKGLYAANNSLSSFDCIRDMENLTALDVTRNKFPRPTQDVFVKLTQVRDLSMFNQTRFLKIAAKVFAPLISINALRIDRLVDYRNLQTLFPNLYQISLTTRTWNCSYTQQVVNALTRQKIRINYNNYYDRAICNIKQTL